MTKIPSNGGAGLCRQHGPIAGGFPETGRIGPPVEPDLPGFRDFSFARHLL
jgi:hypothetical protein